MLAGCLSDFMMNQNVKEQIHVYDKKEPTHSVKDPAHRCIVIARQ